MIASIELGLPVPVDAGDRDDLAASHRERDAAHLLELALVAHVQVVHLERDVARRGRRLVDAQQHVAADHHPCEAVLGRAFARDGVDPLAAPEHRDPVGDLEHLVQLVADEDDRLAVGLQAADDREELARLLRRQHRRRLVEDQDLGAAEERLQDLDPLLLADGDARDERRRVDREPELLRELAHPLLGAALVEQHDVAHRLDAEHDVLGDGHHRDQHEVLVHHADACPDRVLGRRERDGLAVDDDLSLVRPRQAVEDVHQRRLAGAVLAEQRVHLAAPQVEVDVVVGDDSRVALGDPPQLEDAPALVRHRDDSKPLKSGGRA